MEKTGIFNQAKEAKILTEMKSDEEKVKLATSAALIDGKGKINYTDLITELNKEFSNTEYSIVEGDDTTSEWTIQITKNAVNYKITSKGSAEQTINWEQVLANATKHPDQSSTNPDIGVDMYGNPVNMDLWYYELNSENNTIKLGTQEQIGSKIETVGAYKGEMTSEGKIIGEIPQYVKSGDDVYILRSLYRGFCNIDNLVIAPSIPESVEDMQETFKWCDSLTQVPKIPNSVTSLTYTFSECSSLVQAPIIPNTVTSLSSTFFGCSSLTDAPEIPLSVTSMNRTFEQCSSLSKAPDIPSSVTWLNFTFYYCASLTGVMKIDAELSDVNTANPNANGFGIFLNAATNEGTNLVVTGTCPYLDEIIATKSGNSHITKGN